MLLWSGFITLSRLGVRTSFAAHDLIALRFAVGGVVMLPTLLIRRGLAGLAWWQVAVLAGGGGLGFSLFAFAGFSRAPAAHGAVLMPGALPFYMTLLAWLALGESVTPRRLLGLALIVLGIGAVAWDSIALPGTGSGVALAGDRPWLGDLAFLCAPLSWSVFAVAARAWRLEPLQATALVVVPSAAVFLPIYLMLPEQRLWTAPLSETVFQGIYQGVFATVLSTIAFTRAVRALGAARTAIATSVTPTAAALLAVPVVGEVPSWLNAAGLALVTGGMLIGVGASAVRKSATA